MRAKAISIIHLFLLIGFGDCLKDVNVVVPLAVPVGEGAVFICTYDLEEDPLYTVKWYKGSREFYRYTPKDIPTIKVFPMHGLTYSDVDREKCNGTQVTLTHVSRSMTGQYSCEVSADAPSFHTSLVSALMHVVEVPRGKPELHGIKRRYKIGDRLVANCTSPASRPPANLTWTLNGRHVNKEYIRQYRVVEGEDQELSMSILEVPLSWWHSNGGRLRIKCTATLFDIYNQSQERNVALDSVTDYNEIPEDDFDWQYIFPSISKP